MLPLPTIYKRSVPFGKYPVKSVKCEDIKDLQRFSVDTTTTLTAIFTPGHTDDHVSFLLEEDRAIFTGDCVLGCGTSVFDDLYDYMKSLERLRQVILSSESNSDRFIQRIYPGHGPVLTNALHKIEEYISHRSLREQQIMHVLKENIGWIPAIEVVDIVYGLDISPIIRISALMNVSHHLQKLRQDGKVDTTFPDMWRYRIIPVDK